MVGPYIEMATLKFVEFLQGIEFTDKEYKPLK